MQKYLLTLVAVLTLSTPVAYAAARDAGPAVSAVAPAAPVAQDASPATVVAVPVVDVAPESATSRGLGGLIEVLGAGMVLVIGFLFAKLLRAVERKTKITLPAAWEAELAKLIPKGVHYAEEQAHKLVKAKTGNLAPNEKMEVAMNFVIDMAEQSKVKDLGKDKLKMLIESWLNENKR